MSGLKKLLEKSRQKAEFKETKAHVLFAPEPKAKHLPEEKTLKKNSSQSEQCFIIIPDVHSYLRDKKAFDLCMMALPKLAKKYNVKKGNDGDVEFGVSLDEGVIVDVDNYSDKLTRLVLVPNPSRILLQIDSSHSEELWKLD